MACRDNEMMNRISVLLFFLKVILCVHFNDLTVPKIAKVRYIYIFCSIEREKKTRHKSHEQDYLSYIQKNEN